MRYLKYAGLAAVLLAFILCAAGNAQAQVKVGIGVGVGPVYVGPEPVCTWGYYPYYPYACAPYAYWGPNYFFNGVFIGVGPWYHAHYWGRDWDHGYRGGYYGHGYYGRGGYGRTYGNGYRGAPVRGGYHGNSGFHGN